jgi:ABC-2 type transport system ATP-binding protein
MAKDKGHLVIADDPKNDVAISVEGVHKSFKLPHNRQNSIKGSIINLVAKGDRSFETQEVLKDISFQIKKGEFFGIVGRNGSGKSTLLKMLAGIYTPTSGKIIVNGSLTPFIELGVGFNPELTGRENVFLNGALLGFNDKEVDGMYDEIVRFAELERFMDQRLKNYSSGMQVRLAFSIAIRARSEILLLDEVLAVGDAAFQAKCYDYFYELRQKGATVIFVSHDRSSLERFCTNGILIDNGRILCSGNIGDVLESYTSIVLEQMEGGSNKKETKDSAPLKQAQTDAVIRSIDLVDDDGTHAKNVKFGTKISLRYEVEFLADALNPIVGATLWKRGVSEHAIYAANNLTEGIGELGKRKRGDKLKMTIDMPGYLNDGEYSIEIGIANDSVTRYLLQKKEAYSFKIFGSNNPHALLASPGHMQLQGRKKRGS